MISYDEAQKIVWDAASQYALGVESLSLNDIDGRVCAQDVVAPLSVQPFDNSAMDGFAVLRSDLADVSEGEPITLSNTGIIAAGDCVPDAALESGQCIQIMTGAPVPFDADAVVPIECVKVDGPEITFTMQPKKHANIRFAGEDFKKGEALLKSGDRLSIEHILPLASLGIEKVCVFKKPRVAFLATGRELVDDLSTPLKSGQIYNSNRPYAVKILEAMGMECVTAMTIHDDVEYFSKTLEELGNLELDMIVSSGAVSAGEFDFVKNGLETAGADVLYHKNKLKPGKPSLLARLTNGTLYFGLPGNPVASAVGLRFYVGAAALAMTGQDREKPIHARAMNKFSKKAGLHMILKGCLKGMEDGALSVDILDGQASFMVSPFLKMDCWVHVRDDVEEVNSGDCLDVYPLLPI